MDPCIAEIHGHEFTARPIREPVDKQFHVVEQTEAKTDVIVVGLFNPQSVSLCKDTNACRGGKYILIDVLFMKRIVRLDVRNKRKDHIAVRVMLELFNVCTLTLVCVDGVGEIIDQHATVPWWLRTGFHSFRPPDYVR